MTKLSWVASPWRPWWTPVHDGGMRRGRKRVPWWPADRRELYLPAPQFMPCGLTWARGNLKGEKGGGAGASAPRLTDLNAVQNRE